MPEPSAEQKRDQSEGPRGGVTRRRFLEAMGGAAALVGTGLESLGGPRGRQPNVLLIIADDLGYGDVGAYGCTDIPTPHLDRLAAEGVRCSEGYVTWPACAPSRAAIMTGRYQERFGFYHNQDVLPPTETTLPRVLGQAGYVNGLIGKWHLGCHPLDRGFDEFFGFVPGLHPYLPHNRMTARWSLQDGREPVPPAEMREYLTERLTEEGVAFIRRHHRQPFFLCQSYNAPHRPIVPPPEYLKRIHAIEDPMRRRYAAMVASMDKGIGRLLSRLRELDLERDTLVAFLSDNGGKEKYGANNGVLRGGKGYADEGGIRVPFMFRWPGRLPAGQVSHQPISAMDLLPTFAAAAGASIPADVEGVNLTPYLTGRAKGQPHEALYWMRTIRRGDWKYRDPDDGPPRLHNLAEDPGERVNLIEERPQLAASLRRQFQTWKDELPPPT